MRILLPHAKRKPGPKVVICDNLSNHLNENVIQKCKKHDIKFVFLPSNTTHLTQPLDVTFFGPMKRKWRNLLGAWKMTAEGRRNTMLPTPAFPRLLKQLWNAIQPTAETNLIKGFEMCGIRPISAQKLIDKLPKKKDLKLDAVGSAFINFIETKRAEITSTYTPRRRKATNVVAGWYYNFFFLFTNLPMFRFS